ncbi:unnamed protein product [Brachionus calyciflorus]|uniref:pyridoxal 5'-phosphate synthase n=1 Tax=Brachionus calyciflorus TaxID=104777 RepID=A0A813QMX2_9BILA|nr:unnamed protein product [Brachionus calyciflorus]
MVGETKFDISNLNSKNPLKQFESWYQDAKNAKSIKSPNCACLATCSSNCEPSCRMIEINEFNDNGFLFFTHYDSKKARDLSQNRNCSLCFYWDQLDRQVVMCGRVEKISEKESMEFFQRRTVPQQLKTLASQQGKVIKDKEVLVERQQKLAKEFEQSQRMPVPETYVGYLFKPEEFDFWQGNVNDLDDRIRFRKRKQVEDESLVTMGEGNWAIERIGA